MFDFLNDQFLSNTYKSYLIAAGVILFILLLKKYISHYLAGLMFRLVKRIWKDVDKKSFTSLLVQPLGFFLLILVTIISLYKLHFPAVMNEELYDYSLKQIFHCIATIILIVSFIWLLLRIIDFITLILERKADLTPDQTDNQLIVFFRDFFKVVVAIIGIMMILNYAFGLNVASLITGLSIVGAAIALALRESLENLIASFIIFFDKPFTTGDLVKVHQVSGTVEKIGLRSTRIRTDQTTHVTVPNKQMVDSIIDNLSNRSRRRGELRLEPELSTSTAQLEKLITGIRALTNRNGIEQASVFLAEVSANAYVITVEFFTPHVTMAAFNATRQELTLDVMRLFEKEGVKLAGAQKEVFLRQA